MTTWSADLAPCGLRHISLDGPATSIAPTAQENAVYAVFWRKGRPVGLRVLLAAEAPVPQEAVASLAADAAGPAVAAADPADFAPAPPLSQSMTVVICTRDRAQDLTRCLNSLVGCSPPPAEIIVVDNASRDDATAQAVRAFPGVRYVREDRPGLSRARNAGICAATGEIVAFTDDDVELPSDWIARLAAPFHDPEVGCVTGLVLPADLSGEAACLFEFEIGGFGKTLDRQRFDKSFLSRHWRRPPEVWKIGAGANMAVRRAVFGAVGLFDPRLGAGASGCSEDSEFWFRMLRAGHVCLYDPAVVVSHHHRGDRAALRRQMRAYIQGHVMALFVQFAQDRRPAHLIRVFYVMPRSYLKQSLRALLRRNGSLQTIVVPQIRGYLDGLLKAPFWLRQAGPPHLDPQPPAGERA